MEKHKFTWLLGPLLCLVLIAAIILAERTGVKYDFTASKAVFLPAGFNGGKAQAGDLECVILYDSGSDGSIKCKDSISFVLESMCVVHDVVDTASDDFPDLSDYRTVVVALQNYDVISNNVFELFDWVESGGAALFAMSPESTPTFGAVYTKMGIQYCEFTYGKQTGLRFETDLLPGSKGMEFGMEAIDGNGIVLRLRDACRLHMVSLDEKQIPLLWDLDHGQGRIVVYNNDILANKEARGVVAAAYSLLLDACVYPVINASVFFIDDFPAPLPEGYHNRITEQFGRNISSFYKNVWWPDMIDIQKKYGIKYTGLLVETYTDNVTGPFIPELNVENFKYFGALLINNGGELGLHGYNHMPLCLGDYDYKGIFEYNTWPDKARMSASLTELLRFGVSLFPNNDFVTYVPPSNILSDDGREMLKEDFPQVKVISGTYLGENYEIEQEFNRGEDGIINLPRIAAGCEISPYMRWVAFNELGFHYVNSHFLHPDDVLDDERGAQKGWIYLREKFEAYVSGLDQVAPSLRNLTAQQAAAAVERYDHLFVRKKLSADKIVVSLDGFYDEAWLMLRLNKGIPGRIEGGSFEQVSGNLYLIHATQPQVTIYTEEKPK